MNESPPCQGCGAAIVDYPLDPYVATLTGDPTFPYFLVCPPGQNCNIDSEGQTITGGKLFCYCFGHYLWADYLPGQNLVVLMSALIAQCQNQYGGEGPDPETSKNPIPVNTVPLYLNAEQHADSDCPSGNNFTFTVPAGTFVARSQAAADKAAKDYANKQSIGHKVCLGPISSSEVAFNVAAALAVTATGPGVAATGNTWNVSSGALPTGLALAGTGPTVAITGTPTAEGSFTFTLEITTPTGDTNSRSYTVCVVEIDNTDPLLDGMVLSPYSETLIATACATSPLSWQISAGALPPGLALDEPTGVISGTPTTKGVYNFTVLLQTSAT
jgi:hypothetical protein